ncbi:MAG: DUF6798 domain-containing protein [Anaerolineales bacterium]
MSDAQIRLVPAQARGQSILARAGSWLGWGALFALAYGQSPLYTSNQNQYFLHGLARAGYGGLRRDWLAITLDPTPVFSWLVRWTYSLAGPEAFYVIYGLLLAVYLISLASILRCSLGVHLRGAKRALLLAGLITLHSAALRLVLGRLLGDDAAYLFEGGMAGQRLLGPVLQPSSFGALLLLSLALFFKRRPYAAAAAAAMAAVIHPTYLLAAACLVLGYQWALIRRDGARLSALVTGGIALLLVLPTLLYTLTVFRPTSEALWRESAQILIGFRIPHHAEPAQWFGPLSVAKLALIAAGLWLSRRSRLLPALASLTIFGVGLTLLELATGSDRLALLFPWRVSVVLVPLGSGLLLARLLSLVAGGLDRVNASALHGACLAVAVLLAAAGLSRTWWLANEPDAADGVYNFVGQHLDIDDSYLIPPKLETFRLATGAPAFVDFKSIPYRDTDVIEWRERVQLADFFYRDDPALISCDVLEQIQQRASIDHVLLEAKQFGLTCPGMRLQYQDSYYALYRYQP